MPDQKSSISAEAKGHGPRHPFFDEESDYWQFRRQNNALEQLQYLLYKPSGQLRLQETDRLAGGSQVPDGPTIIRLSQPPTVRNTRTQLGPRTVIPAGNEIVAQEDINPVPALAADAPVNPFHNVQTLILRENGEKFPTDENSPFETSVTPGTWRLLYADESGTTVVVAANSTSPHQIAVCDPLFDMPMIIEVEGEQIFSCAWHREYRLAVLLNNGRLLSLDLGWGSRSQCDIHVPAPARLQYLSADELLVAPGDGGLFIWNIATDDCHIPNPEDSAPVAAFAVLPDGRVVSGSDQAGLSVSNLCEHQSEQRLERCGQIRAISVLPEGDLLLGTADGRLLKLSNWSGDMVTDEISELAKLDSEIVFAKALANGQVVAISRNGQLLHLSGQNTQPAALIPQLQPDSIREVWSYGSGAQILVVTTADRILEVTIDAAGSLCAELWLPEVANLSVQVRLPRHSEVTDCCWHLVSKEFQDLVQERMTELSYPEREHPYSAAAMRRPAAAHVLSHTPGFWLKIKGARGSANYTVPAKCTTLPSTTQLVITCG